MANENEIPFVFGVRVEGNTFTDRKEETNRLKMNFLYGVNTILISPRRMGNLIGGKSLFLSGERVIENS